MKKQRKVKSKIPKAIPPKEVPKPEPEEPEKPFDFGGLPDRNLKKNLGCG